MNNYNINLSLIKKYINLKDDIFLYNFLKDNKIIDENKIEDFYHHDLNEIIKNKDVFNLIINSSKYNDNDVLCFKLEVYSHFLKQILYFINHYYKQLLIENNTNLKIYKEYKYDINYYRTSLRSQSKRVMKYYRNNIFIDIKNILNIKNLDKRIFNSFVNIVKEYNSKDILKYDKKIQMEIFSNDVSIFEYTYCKRLSNNISGGYYYSSLYINDLINNFSTFNYLISEKFKLVDNDPLLFFILSEIYYRSIYYLDKYLELIDILQIKNYNFNVLYKKLNLLEYLNSLIFTRKLSRNQLMMMEKLSNKFKNLGLKIQE